MPSPFPGMDPYLEDPIEWPGVHTNLIVTIQDLLVPQLRPNYVVRIEQRVEIWSPEELRRPPIVPDVFVLERPSPRAGSTAVAAVSPATLIEPLYEETRRTRYIEIRDAQGHEVVATLELLSPTNKVSGGTGRAQFLQKRGFVMHSATHWIEIDLLRAGERPQEVAGKSDYYALLKRGDGFGPYEAWFADLRDRLPAIAIPLRPPHGDVALDLQLVLDTVYSRANYADAIDYTRPVPAPSLLPPDANWVASCVRVWQQSRASASGAE